MKIFPEVLIYINTLKLFLSKNKEAHDYFLGEIDDDVFFYDVEQMSIENFKNFGAPELKREQFDEILLSLSNNKENNIESQIFKYYLN